MVGWAGKVARRCRQVGPCHWTIIMVLLLYRCCADAISSVCYLRQSACHSEHSTADEMSREPPGLLEGRD